MAIERKNLRSQVRQELLTRMRAGLVQPGEGINEVQLATELGRPYKLKTPSTLIDLTLQKAGRELFLADQEIQPKRLLDAGFTFKERTAGHAVELALKSPEFVPEPGAGV